MIKHFYGPKKRRKFDMDADWLPQKNRPFVLKGSQSGPPEAKGVSPPPVPDAKPEPRCKTTDA